jgi:hypothetical protein
MLMARQTLSPIGLLRIIWQEIFNTSKGKLFEPIINEIAELCQPERLYLHRYYWKFFYSDNRWRRRRLKRLLRLKRVGLEFLRVT